MVNKVRSELGNLTEITLDGKLIISDVAYRADGKLSKQEFGNGIKETRRYDLHGRIVEQRIVNGDDDTSKW